MEEKSENINNGKTRWLLGAGIAAAFTATLCCIAPLVLFLLGISGAWVAEFTALEPYRPYFMTAAIIFVVAGYWKVYRKPKAADCKPGTYCAMPKSDRINKIMLWVATAIIALVLVYPYIAPAILEHL